MRALLLVLALLCSLSVAHAEERIAAYMGAVSAVFFIPSHPYYGNFSDDSHALPETALFFWAKIGSIAGISVSVNPYAGDLLYGYAEEIPGEPAICEGPFLDKKETSESFPYIGTIQSHIIDIGVESPRNHPLSFVVGGGPSLMIVGDDDSLGFRGDEPTDAMIEDLESYARDHGASQVIFGANVYCYAAYEFGFLGLLGGAKLRWFGAEGVSLLSFDALLRGAELFAGIGIAFGH